MLTNPYQPYSQAVTVTRSQDVEPALQAAVDRAMAEAMNFPVRGILVTRHNHNSFTVTLSESVPFGTTLELDLRDAEE